MSHCKGAPHIMRPSTNRMVNRPLTVSPSEGGNLFRRILDQSTPFDTHDYQMDAITYLLDSQDVLFITATRSGKTDAFMRVMHVVQALTRDRRFHVPPSKFPKVQKLRNCPPVHSMGCIENHVELLVPALRRDTPRPLLFETVCAQLGKGGRPSLVRATWLGSSSGCGRRERESSCTRFQTHLKVLV
ncbi:hypothetical protein F5I97DRAFT_965220 [Phlebopus sp. FC_14]|nr:hypothetical protein F5I97DRAFT_965220 [Phlebopus sp. FC_14]